jgi:phage terminase large subunit
MPKQVTVPYVPREAFMPFHTRSTRWAALICHRRAGKTVAVVNDITERALYAPRPRSRYAYIAPFYSQAKQIAWDYLKYYTQQVQVKTSEAALSVELFNGSRISLYGADNPDSMRGLYFDGVAVDEYGNCRPNLWTEILRPALSDRKGWGTFIGTPNGPNHFYDVWENAVINPLTWYTMCLKASESGILPQEELDEMRATMSEDEYEAEMECSWFASIKGSYYGQEIKNANIGNFPLIPHIPAHYVFDLGYRDSTAIWRWQETPTHIRLSLAEEFDSKSVAFYTDWLHNQRDSGITIGKVYLPHDASAKSLQTGRSIVELFLSAGVRPHLVPNMSIQDGISAARYLFKSIVFDEAGCYSGLKALKAYQREFDEERKVFRDHPLHNYASNFADSFRYFALVAKAPHQFELPETIVKPPLGQGAHHVFTLDQLFNDRLLSQENYRL